MPVLVGADGFVFDDRWGETPVGHGLSSAGTTATSISSLILLAYNAAPITLTSTPSILAGTTQGQRLRVFNNGTQPITFQDISLIASTLRFPPNLGHTFTLAAGGGVAEFIWLAPYWYLVGSFGN
jgi:hypothetical protein